jgi:phosphatidylglycerol lysyltransferase
MVLDEVKRAPNAPPGTVELLIARSLDAFRGRAGVASLGLAPIAGTGTALVARALCDVLGVRSASPGLLAFKAKFRPTWESRYLVVERPVDVPAVLLAVLLLHHPELLRRSRVRTAYPRALG